MPTRIMYCRKSTEAEDRQVASIESQTTELNRLAEKLDVSIDEVLSEARSAKAPGRPVFNALMARVYRGQVQSIFCWKLDRLARNPVDGGSLIWAMKQHGLEIITPTQTFRQADDNKILLYIEFGMAEKYVDDLSRNVKRGLRGKVEKGWQPGVAPVGYLNDKTKPLGERTVIPDPERFPLVRRMWEMMLTGSHSPPQIVEIANTEWGFRTRATMRQGGRPLARSTIYRILTDPFYYGWFEYPRGSGLWHRGRHVSMVTEEEFRRVQIFLGRHGDTRASRHSFPFTGLIRCGECTGAVTAEEKHHLVCPQCRYKFAYRQKDRCPRCETLIEDMQNPRYRYYTYYHCTRTLRPACSQCAVQGPLLEQQVAAFLARIEVSEGFRAWAQSYLKELHALDMATRHEIAEAQERTYRECTERLQNLLRLKTSPQNADGALISDEEYANQRAALLKEKARLEDSLQGTTTRKKEERLVRAEKTFGFACRARTAFLRRNSETKKQILSTVQSNLTLIDKKLVIKAKYPFHVLAESPNPLRGIPASIEPLIRSVPKRQKEAHASLSLTVLGRRDDVRTFNVPAARKLVAKIYRYFQETDEVIDVPVIEELEGFPSVPGLIDSSTTTYKPLQEDDWNGAVINF